MLSKIYILNANEFSREVRFVTQTSLKGLIWMNNYQVVKFNKKLIVFEQ